MSTVSGFANSIEAVWYSWWLADIDSPSALGGRPHPLQGFTHFARLD